MLKIVTLEQLKGVSSILDGSKTGRRKSKEKQQRLLLPVEEGDISLEQRSSWGDRGQRVISEDMHMH